MDGRGGNKAGHDGSGHSLSHTQGSKSSNSGSSMMEITPGQEGAREGEGVGVGEQQQQEPH